MPRSAMLGLVDGDGVMLSFTALLWERLAKVGIELPMGDTLEKALEGRFFHHAFPSLVSRELEARLVEEIFDSGDLGRQPGYDEVDYERLGGLFSSNRLYVLTKIPPRCVEDRRRRLSELFGRHLPAEKILLSWGPVSKGDIIVDICKRAGIPPTSAILYDDMPENLESAYSVGATGIMVVGSLSPRQEVFERFPVLTRAALADNIALSLGL